MTDNILRLQQPKLTQYIFVDTLTIWQQMMCTPFFETTELFPITFFVLKSECHVALKHSMSN